MKPTFFRTPTDFRAWLAEHHASEAELLVGFFKKRSGEPSITWPESVDEALCFGWIDGVRKRVDERSYTIRFTPRKPGSIWSDVNVTRARALIEEGRMQPAGLTAFEARREGKSGIYSYEQRNVELAEPYARLLKEDEAGWRFFEAQPASYRKAVSWWIMGAKKEETRLKRLGKLAEHSARGQRLPQFTSTKAKR
jgi:uncharacterized protein YdeI (YjbR/CyaY-like superfamily)